LTATHPITPNQTSHFSQVQGLQLTIARAVHMSRATSAVTIERARGAGGHAALVRFSFGRAGSVGVPVYRLADGRTGDPPVAVTGST